MKILIVDGDHQLLETMKEICHLEGFPVVTHNSCEKALADLRSGLMPTMIFCDVFPPKNAGLDFQRELLANENWKSIPFVLMRSLPLRNPHRQELTKPFSMDEMISFIKRV